MDARRVYRLPVRDIQPAGDRGRGHPGAVHRAARRPYTLPGRPRGGAAAEGGWGECRHAQFAVSRWKLHSAGPDEPSWECRTGIAAGSPIPIDLMKQLIEKLNLTELTVAYGMSTPSDLVYGCTA